MENPDVFLFIGHGLDTLVDYNERPLVPAGSTVIMFSDQGRPVAVSVAKEIWKQMYISPELFKEPIKNKNAIEELLHATMHIYPEGTPMPVLNHYLNAYFGKGADSKNISLSSGSYTLPLQTPEIQQVTRFDPYFSDEDILHLYAGDANKPFRDDIFSLDRIGSKIPFHELDKIFYPTPDLIQMQGPGIHYLLSCRSISTENLSTTLGYSNYELLSKLQNAFDSDNISYENILSKQEEQLLKNARMLKIKDVWGTLPALSNKGFNLFLKGIKNERERQAYITKRAFAKQFLNKKNSLLGKLATLRNRVKLTRNKSQKFQATRFPRSQRRTQRRRRN